MARAVTPPINQGTSAQSTLYLACALGAKTWKLGFTIGVAQRPRERNIPAGNIEKLIQEIAPAKKRFGLPEEARVVSCYAAGRESFWLHRCLVAPGVENLVVDSASIEVNRRQRRAKPDRLDVHKLLTMLMRHWAGEQKGWSVVRVPSGVEEDRRQLHRELMAAKRDRTRGRNRIQGLLASQGISLEVREDCETQLGQVHLWHGSGLPPGVRARLQRAWHQVRFFTDQIQALAGERRAGMRESEEPVIEQVRQLCPLRGIGIQSAWLCVLEFCAWRDFQNTKQVGALAGLTPTPYQSGQSHHELGRAKAGNRHIRALAIEMAWCWLRYQPTSALAQWYQRRFGAGGPRLRKIGIVALARKLLVALWRFLRTGLLPEHAVLKVPMGSS